MKKSANIWIIMFLFLVLLTSSLLVVRLTSLVPSCYKVRDSPITKIIINIGIWSAGWPELEWSHSSWHQFSCPPLWGLPDSLHGEMIFTMMGNKINCSRQRLNVSAGPGPLRITRNFRTIASCSQQWTKLTISPTASGKEVDIENWIRHFKIFRIFLWKV